MRKLREPSSGNRFRRCARGLALHECELAEQVDECAAIGDLVKTGWQKNIANFLEMQSRRAEASPRRLRPAMMIWHCCAMPSTRLRPIRNSALRWRKSIRRLMPKPEIRWKRAWKPCSGRPRRLRKRSPAAVACGLEVSDGTRATCDFY